MTESSLLDKAYTLRQEGKFKESYDTLYQAAEVAGDPMEKASVLLAAVTDLLSLENVELAKTQLETIKGLLVDLDASPTSDQEQRLRLNLGVELQEALIMAGDTVSKEKTEDALAAFDALITRYGSSLDASYLKDIKHTIYAERAFVLADLGLFEESLPILQELEGSLSENPSVVFYLGYCRGLPKITSWHGRRWKRRLPWGSQGILNFALIGLLEALFVRQATLGLRELSWSGLGP